MDSTLNGRAAGITAAAATLSEELAKLDLAEPSFERGLPEVVTGNAPRSDAREAREKLLHLLDDFRMLVTEPANLLVELRNPLLPVNVAIQLGIAENFPQEGTTVQDLAAKLDLVVGTVRRILSHCATYHIYYQRTDDYFVHTAASRLLADSSGMRDWIALGVEEMLPACFKSAEALTRFPNSEEPEHSVSILPRCWRDADADQGWTLKSGTELPIFKALALQPKQAALFARCMEWNAKLPGLAPQYLAESIPWKESMTLVDVGGGVGHISMVLAGYNPTVKCIVQDFKQQCEQGQADLPESMRGRITFQPHDFFQEQPVKGADVYLLRMILHDWGDKYAKQIVAALVPALKPGAKVIINDRIVPAFGEAHLMIEREARDLDMLMMGFQNARERTLRDWIALFGDVDSRFTLKKAYTTPEAILSMLDFTWDS